MSILDEIEVNEAQVAYVHFHAKRYAYLLEEVTQVAQALDLADDPKILDIGPAYQTSLFRSHLKGQINTMGFDHPINVKRTGERHFPVDLNHTDVYRGAIIPHDLIVFSEVIEHLYTPPEIVLEFVLQFLKPGGYLLLQTPNAVATFKRMMMVFGYNPFDLINAQRDGHFREYTTGELHTLFIAAGLEVVKVDRRNYFNYAVSYQKIYRCINQLLPPGFRDGITIIGRKKDERVKKIRV